MQDYTCYDEIKDWAVKPAQWKHGPLWTYHSHELRRLQSQWGEVRALYPAPRSPEYRPVPWEHQYDLEMYIWAEWSRLNLLERAIHVGRLEAAKAQGEDTAPIQARIDRIDEVGFTGFPRSEHLLRAAELRWPTYKDSSGEWRGSLKRSAWLEAVFQEMSGEGGKNRPGHGRVLLSAYGGGAQGKTTMYLAVALMIWDHFTDTANGATCTVTTNAVDKLEQVTWATLRKLYTSSAAGISRYAGRGVFRGVKGQRILTREDLERKGTQEGGGSSFRGLALRHNLGPTERDAIRDRITGDHGKEAKVIVVDEAQSCLDALFGGVENYFSSVPHGLGIFAAAGNFTRRTDTLGRNVRPVGGWDSVQMDQEHPFGITRYDAIAESGAYMRVMHFNNLKSPRWSPQGDPEMFKDLWKPSVEDGESLAMLLANPSSASFIIAWHDKPEDSGRKLRDGEGPVPPSTEIEKLGLGRYFEIDPETRTGFVTFDAAPSFGDRNTVVAWAIGNSRELGGAVLQPVGAYVVPPLPPGLDRATRYPIYVIEHLTRAAQHAGIPQVAVYDESAHGTLGPALAAADWERHPFMFHALPPGAKPGEPGLTLGGGLQAHNTVKDRAALGAYALRQLYASGQMANLRPEMFEAAEREARIGARLNADQEFYSRTLYKQKFEKRGLLWVLQSKAEMKGPSTDWFDNFIMAAHHAVQFCGFVPGERHTAANVLLPPPEASTFDPMSALYAGFALI